MIAFLLLFVALGRLYRDMVKQPETRALLIAATVLLVVGAVFYTRVEHWTVLNAVYFCVVTLGTVGYGDITPTTDLGKLFTIFYIIVGLGIVGGFFATVGRLIYPGLFVKREKALLGRETQPGDTPPTQVNDS
jgi:voltage-gated potassium channel